MKNSTSAIIFLLLMSSCGVTSSQNVEFHPFVLKAQQTSLYADQIDWKEVNKEFVSLTDGKQSVEELKEGLQYLVNSLGDKHGQIRSTKDYSIVVSYRGRVTKNDSKEREGEFIDQVINDVDARFSYQLLEDKVGYLKIVGIGQGDVKEQAQIIRNGLVELKRKGVKTWILDLRYNGGGNVEPMISGVAPLLGDGFIGGAINSQDEIRPYRIENGQFYNYNRLCCPMDENPEIKSNEKLVVLLSRYTISSGEMLAIAFKGRENTLFLGEKTAGYTTGNGYDQISDELALIISQSIFIDRNKNVYDVSVPVDEEIEFIHNLDLEGDLYIDRAIKWLKG